MKSKQIALLAVLTGLLFATLGIFGQQAAAQSNLLTNPGFEGGYYNQDGIPEIAVPNGWRMHWIDGQPFNGSNGNAARPETVVWNIKDAPEAEQILFFKDGSYAFKIFKGWAPVYSALSQDVTGLEVGRKYRLAAPIYIDIVESYEGRKRPPTKLDSGQVRLGASATGVAWRDEANIQYSPIWTAGTISPFYLAYPIFLYDFVATSPNMTVWVEMGSIDPYINNGFFLDGISLTALDEVDPSVAGSGSSSGSTGSGSTGSAPAVAAVAAGPTAPPAPTATPRADGAVIHVVQAGDSFWSIAIQYAATMGLTSEEALAAIPALNNNPTTINPGDELIIVPPGELEPEATPTAEITEEPAQEATAEPVNEEATAESETETSITNGVCVLAYEDEDGDAVYFIENEKLLADTVISLLLDGNNKASYVTDGVSEPFCFENLEAGTYQVQVIPPAGYQATTAESWSVAVAEGVIIPVTFGLAPAPQEVAEVSPTESPDAAADTANTETEETAVAEESGGGLGSISGLLLIGAAFVVLLAGVGVFLLRRG